MTDNTPKNDLEAALQNLENTLAEAEADHSEDMRSRSVNLRQRIRNFLGGEGEDREGLRAELLEWETQVIETRPRLASALRSAVAIIETAGL